MAFWYISITKAKQLLLLLAVITVLYLNLIQTKLPAREEFWKKAEEYEDIISAFKEFRESPVDGIEEAKPHREVPIIVGYPEPRAYGNSPEVVKVINRERSPVKFVHTTRDTLCHRIRDCVTLITKTRHRLGNVAQLVKSFHRFFPNTSVIVADDFNPNYPADAPAVWFEVYSPGGQHRLVTYVQVEEGISEGRNVALRMASTKYVLLVDDDHVFLDESALTLLKALEFTDATLAGGQFGEHRFDALVRAILFGDHVDIAWYPNIYYQKLEPIVDCFATDRIQNFFLAHRQGILDIGGWDADLKVFEHMDFFLNLRSHGKKILYCPMVTVRHDLSNMTLHVNRNHNTHRYLNMVYKKWGVNGSYSCSPFTYFEPSCKESLTRSSEHVLGIVLTPT